jgi:glycosyltransferase involved in cell wall biosynthesis
MVRTAKNKFRWFIVTPFLKEKDTSWLSAFIRRETVTFEYVNANYTHVRWRSKTNLFQWLDYFSQSVRTIFMARKGHQEGFVTVFPQLAFTIAVCKWLFGSNKPLVAWCFNVGTLPTGVKLKIACLVLQKVDLFVVHSSAEIATISAAFNLPISKIVFLPLQRALMPQKVPVEKTAPFIVALGTAQRDYKTLLEAVDGLDIQLTIVASAESLAGLTIPSNVTIYEKLNSEQCHALIQRSTFVVTPLKTSSTAAGQVTMLDAMMYQKASISTNVVGTIDYAADGTTTMLIPPFDVAKMRQAILKLWTDPVFRQTMENNALKYVTDELSDETLAKRLDQILISFERKVSQ